jgi:hypothetical protein
MAAGLGAATPNENDLFAMGFASGQSTGSTTNDRFLSGNVVGQAWSLVRGSTTTNGNNNAIMHTSWGMHANQGGGTGYAHSTASVLTPGSPTSQPIVMRPTTTLLPRPTPSSQRSATNRSVSTMSPQNSA